MNLARSSLRFMLQHRWQTGLTLLGITLGVAVVVGVDLANNSARRAFSLSLDAVTGSSTHQIVGGPAGIPEQVYVRLRRETGLQKSSPLVTDRVSINGRSFTLLGIDPISELAPDRRRIPLASSDDFITLLQPATLAMVSGFPAKWVMITSKRNSNWAPIC